MWGKHSKTRSRRLVPVTPNLLAWLQPIAKPAGPVIEKELRYRHKAGREGTGIKDWPQNSMQHSAHAFLSIPGQLVPRVVRKMSP